MKENKTSSKSLFTRTESWVIGVTLVMFSLSSLATFFHMPKLNDTVIIYSSSSAESETSSKVSSENTQSRISSSELEYLLGALGRTPSSANDNISGKININTANVELLMELNGIGEVKANAIIEYRTNYGDFASLEEIMNVKGIGEKTFEKIKDYITY